MTGDKTSSGSIVEVTGCLLFLLSGEASEQQTVVAGGIVCPLTVKASGVRIPKMTGWVLLLPTGKAIGEL